MILLRARRLTSLVSRMSGLVGRKTSRAANDPKVAAFLRLPKLQFTIGSLGREFSNTSAVQGRVGEVEERCKNEEKDPERRVNEVNEVATRKETNEEAGPSQRRHVLDRPSETEIPLLRDKYWFDFPKDPTLDWAEVQAQRKVFKGLPFSKTPYARYNGALDPAEMRSFCAAGYFLWRLGNQEPEVLMLWEDRKAQRLLNFPGGMRDNAEEGPVVVAARETYEETAYLLSQATLLRMQDPVGKPVVAIPASKYALCVLELTEPADQAIREKFAALPRGAQGGPLPLVKTGGDAGVLGLAWVGASALLRRQQHEELFHPFTHTMISALLASGALPPAFTAACAS